MNNNYLKKIIIFFIILLIIVLITIIGISLLIKIQNQSAQTENTGEDVLENYGKNSSGGIDEQSYFDIKKCMQIYLDYLNIDNSQYYGRAEDGGYVRDVEESYVKQNIYNLLSNKYINENNITIDNVYKYVDELKDPTLYVLIEADLIQDGDIKSFLTYGLIEEMEDYKVIDKIFTVVNIDVSKGCFSIEPIYGNYKDINEIKINKMDDKIILNNLNKFSMTSISKDDLPKEYINLYKRLALGEPEELYKLLDEDYKKLRFETFEIFKNYIEKNRSEIQSIRLEGFYIVTEGENTKYICIDQNKKYYVINQKEILEDYTIILDTYTIDLPEFIKKYDSSEEHIKVALNIEKLISATKDGDYKYVYNKMDNTFKNTKFGTEEKFEKYIKQKYNPNEDILSYGKYEKISGTHIYEVELTDVSENNKIKAKIVMQLKDERDFVFSFSTEN